MPFNYSYVWRFVVVVVVGHCFVSFLLYLLITMSWELWAHSRCGWPIQFISLVYLLFFFFLDGCWLLVGGLYPLFEFWAFITYIFIHFCFAGWFNSEFGARSSLPIQYCRPLYKFSVFSLICILFPFFIRHFFGLTIPRQFFLFIIAWLWLSFEIRAPIWTQNHFSYIKFIRIKWNLLNGKWRQTMIVAS